MSVSLQGAQVELNREYSNVEESQAVQTVAEVHVVQGIGHGKQVLLNT